MLGVFPNTKDRLDSIKIHPREPYDEVINRIIDAFLKKERKK